jgi:hypothetical protein
MIRKQLPGLVITPGIGPLGIRGGVLDCCVLWRVRDERQDGYSAPNFCAAISCISSRERVPYMSMVVLYDS